MVEEGDDEARIQGSVNREETDFTSSVKMRAKARILQSSRFLRFTLFVILCDEGQILRLVQQLKILNQGDDSESNEVMKRLWKQTTVKYTS